MVKCFYLSFFHPLSTHEASGSFKFSDGFQCPNKVTVTLDTVTLASDKQT